MLLWSIFIPRSVLDPPLSACILAQFPVSPFIYIYLGFSQWETEQETRGWVVEVRVTLPFLLLVVASLWLHFLLARQFHCVSSFFQVIPSLDSGDRTSDLCSSSPERQQLPTANFQLLYPLLFGPSAPPSTAGPPTCVNASLF